ncbi:MAG TPA: NADP-dependent oxidoreductase [Aliidongia sp.]|uniref:NADP-dependent oxidoreductase n=1 Tax=Aliidongia sp. TaxID=1914230 RepID=UPI002DDD6CA4|nr:NADP-dependent oxidoreductase [Aliidongia sp.]HEV2673253.1 NADP-dependent oxidoreductase [Aliidongia sp.]
MATMKAIRIHGFGGVEQLELETIERPVPGRGELLVRVQAASVNPVDFKTREGKFPPIPAEKLPITPGRDIYGEVEALGEGVDSFAVGDHVYAMLGLFHGGYAEYALVAESEAAHPPRKLGPTEAAAVPLAALTAWQGLFNHGHLKAGQKVLIHGGSGGVGHFAIQFARAVGAHVSATASEADLAFVRELGAERAIDYQKERFESAGPFDLILDLIGGETQERSWSALKRGGALISTLTEPSKERAAELQVRTARYMTQPDGRQLTEIGRLIDDGKVEVAVDTIFDLDQARRAQEYQATGHPRGKIVLQVAD